MSGRNFDKTFTLGHLMHEFEYVKDKNKDAVLQYLSNVSGVSEKDLLAELNDTGYIVKCKITGNIRHFVENNGKLTEEEIEKITTKKVANDFLGSLKNVTKKIVDVRKLDGGYVVKCCITGDVFYEIYATTEEKIRKTALEMAHEDDFGKLDHVEVDVEYIEVKSKFS